MNKTPYTFILVILLVAAAYFIGVQTTKIQYLEKNTKNTGTALGISNLTPSKSAKLNVAQNIGIDKNKFKSCLESGKYAKQVTSDLEDGKKVGVNGTPATFVNGQMVSGAMPYNTFKEIIDRELKNP